MAFLISSISNAQSLSGTSIKEYDNFNGCPRGGKPANYDDSMKNRDVIPTKFTVMSFADAAKVKVTDDLPAKAISIIGYVILVKDGGAETCNCKSTDHKMMDVHIELTQDADHTKNTDAIVCEINSHIKGIMSKAGHDWSMQAIKKAILHQQVRISGYTFLDDHHKQNSEADNPKGTTLWRVTTLEMHPVCKIEVNIGTDVKPLWVDITKM